MSKKKAYLFDIIPRWLKYSGLPGQLNQKYGRDAWLIFQCLIELDCRFNPDYPDTFDQRFEEIAEFTGTTRQTVSKYIKAFEDDRLLTMKRGKYKEDKSTFRLNNPIKTPKHPKKIHALNGGLLNRKGKRPILRYAEQVKDVYPLDNANGSKIEGEQVKDTTEQVKDVYYNKKKREEKRRVKQQQQKKRAAVAPSFSPFSQEATLINRITKLGIPQKKAKSLLVRYGKSAVRNQLDWLPQRENIKNPAGAFITALKENWPKPVSPKKQGWEESPKYKRLYTVRREDQEKILNRAKDLFKHKGNCGDLRTLLSKLDNDYKEEFREFEQEQQYEGLED